MQAWARFQARAGKTAIVRQLELDGFSVVEEAATDVI
jgi:predicted ATPase